MTFLSYFFRKQTVQKIWDFLRCGQRIKKKKYKKKGPFYLGWSKLFCFALLHLTDETKLVLKSLGKCPLNSFCNTLALFWSIWVSFPRTGICPDLCHVLEKFWNLVWPSPKSNPLFLKLFLRDLITYITGKLVYVTPKPLHYTLLK